MKYQKTIDLWNPTISQAVHNGTMKLQRGQWVKCGEGALSRFVQRMQSGTLWVSHWQGSPSSTRNRFLEMTLIVKNK